MDKYIVGRITFGPHSAETTVDWSEFEQDIEKHMKKLRKKEKQKRRKKCN
jgi:hypothetical protein